MRIFDHPNLEDGNWRCPLCGTAEDKPVTLVPLPSTQQGNIVQCLQVHATCCMALETQQAIDTFTDALHHLEEDEGKNE